MKLDKKAIIITASTVSVLAFGGIVGGIILKNNDSEAYRVIQNIITGQNFKNYLGNNDMKPAEVKALQNLLSKTGFGFVSQNTKDFGASATTIDLGDQKNETSRLDNLYMLCNGNGKYSYSTGVDSMKLEGNINEKPEYAKDPGKKPELSKTSEYYDADKNNDGEVVKYAKCKVSYTYKGEVKQKVNEDVQIFMGETVEGALKKLEEEINEEYKKDLQEWMKEKEAYNKWTAWKDARNEWISRVRQKGYLEPRETGTTYDDYTEFWSNVASKVMGLTEGTVGEHQLTEEQMHKLKDILYAQVYDENNNPRAEVKNLLNESFKNVKEPVKDLYPVNDKSDPNQGGSGTNSTGDTKPGGSGGGSTGGSGGGSTGGSGGGSTGGSGGGSTSNTTTNNTTGGNTSGENPKEEEPKVEKVVIASPKPGRYTTGQEIKVSVYFDQKVYGTNKRGKITKSNAPELTIKFGESEENKKAEFAEASGKIITYSYTVEEEDNGELKIGEEDNYVGKLYSENGTKIELNKIEFEEESQIIIDTEGPKLEKIEVISKAGEYKINEEVQIKVTFDEKVYTEKNKIPLIEKTAPVLNISFGEGEIKTPTVSEINNEEKYIIYKYPIEAEDNGKLKINEEKTFDGTKTIYDELGNATTLVEGKSLEGSSVTVDNSKLAQIKFDKKEITLDLNGKKSEEIKATVTPKNANLIYSKDIIWKSSNESVVTIGETTSIDPIIQSKIDLETNVKINAIGEGEATITLEAPEGIKATCKVKVTNSSKIEEDDDKEKIEPEKIELNVKNIKVNLEKTDNIQLRTIITPSSSNKNDNIKYESSDEKIATVDENGKVEIKGKGTVVITATSGNEKKSYCAIEIVENSETTDKEKGDINSDKKVDTTDLLMILRHIAAISSDKIYNKHQDWILVEDKYMLADINGNGIIDVTDSLKLQRHIAATKSEEIKEKHPDWIIREISDEENN